MGIWHLGFFRFPVDHNRTLKGIHEPGGLVLAKQVLFFSCSNVSKQWKVTPCLLTAKQRHLLCAFANSWMLLRHLKVWNVIASEIDKSHHHFLKIRYCQTDTWEAVTAPFLNQGIIFTYTFIQIQTPTSANCGLFFFSDRFSLNSHHFLSWVTFCQLSASLSAAAVQIDVTPRMSSFIKCVTFAAWYKDSTRDTENKTSFYVKAHKGLRCF